MSETDELDNCALSEIPREDLIERLEMLQTIIVVYMVQNNLNVLETFPPDEDIINSVMGIQIVEQSIGNDRKKLCIKLVKGH